MFIEHSWETRISDSRMKRKVTSVQFHRDSVNHVCDDTWLDWSAWSMHGAIRSMDRWLPLKESRDGKKRSHTEMEYVYMYRVLIYLWNTFEIESILKTKANTKVAYKNISYRVLFIKLQSKFGLNQKYVKFTSIICLK